MRVLLFLLLLIPVFTQAQIRVYAPQDNPNQIRQFRGGMEGLNYFRFPVQGGHSIPAGDSLWFVRVNPGDGQLYMWNGLSWGCMTCGGSGIVDSNLFVTLSRLRDSLLRVQQTLNDSSAALRGDIPDISGLVPQSRTITINGSTQDLSANRSWTIPVPDTSSLRADIDANSDSILVHRADIDSKEAIIAPGTTSQYWRGDKTWQPFPAIPDISGLIPYSDTGNLIATTYGVDTAKQNIRYEINNLPAPPVTSVNGQTGNVVLQFMDTAYVSGDTIYAEKGGNVFVVGVMTGGGLDTAAVSAIVADSLSGVIRQGGNAFGGAVEIGSNNNQNVRIKVNNSPQIELSGGGMITYGGASQFSLTAASSRIIHNAVTRHEWRVNNQSSFQMSFSSNGLGVGLPNNTSSSAALQVIGTSSTTGAIAIFENSAGDDAVIIRSDLGVEVKALSGAGTGVVTADDDGVLSIQRPPASGIYTLKSVNGVIQWVED